MCWQYLWFAQSMGTLHFEDRVLLSTNQAIDKGLHIVCDKSLLPYSC